MHDISKLKQQDNDEHENVKFKDGTTELEPEIRGNEGADDSDNL